LSQRDLQSVHIDIPVPGPHIRENSQEIETTLSRGKSEETLRRGTEEDPSPGWTETRDVMCTE